MSLTSRVLWIQWNALQSPMLAYTKPHFGWSLFSPSLDGEPITEPRSLGEFRRVDPPDGVLVGFSSSGDGLVGEEDDDNGDEDEGEDEEEKDGDEDEEAAEDDEDVDVEEVEDEEAVEDE